MAILPNFFFRQYRLGNCVFFLGNIGQENFLYDMIERKNVFLDYINKKFKMLKN